jgi:Rrf2 family protein
MSLRLTRAGDYAIRAMIHLGSLPEGGVALKDDVAITESIPSSFMAKILRQLVKGGLLRSARGVNGGFGLSRPATEINLLQIVEAIEGPITLTECSPDPENCTRAHDCPASSVWFEVQKQMTGLLERTTLEALVSAPRKNRKVVYTITN